MTRYVVVRLYSVALTLLGLSLLVFLMLRLVPGTVVEQMIGADAIVSPAMVAELKRFFGLDQPWWRQYGLWVAGLTHGDLGTSWRTGKPVVALILERLPVTMELTALAVACAMVLGIPACMLGGLRSEYIRTAAAKGLTDRVVILKHALKNALIPIVTVAGLQMGILLGGTVVVEEVFTLPGIGRLVLWAIYQRDYPLTQSTILFIAVMFMTINLAVDVLYGYLDPRIRYSA